MRRKTILHNNNKMKYCEFSKEVIENKYEALRFLVSPDNEVIFDIYNSFSSFPKDLLLYSASIKKQNTIYVKWQYIKNALESDIFSMIWEGVKCNFDLSTIYRACLMKILNFISLSKKAGKLTIGKNNILEKIKKIDKYILFQAFNSSQREKFSDLYKPLEYFDNLELSKICGKENIHYVLIEGRFIDEILVIKQQVNYLN